MERLQIQTLEEDLFLILLKLHWNHNTDHNNNYDLQIQASDSLDSSDIITNPDLLIPKLTTNAI